MIRTLVVDDDPLAVLVHRQFTERVAGFEVVGEATTGVAAVELAEQLRPDLVLLDMYLPDLSGIEVMRRIRSSGARDADVIAITSAKDVEMLRAAMQLGVVHYVVKPFKFRTLLDRLETYAAARTQLAGMRHPDQRDIDRLYGLLRSSGEASLPKGISAPTLAMVAGLLEPTQEGTSATALAEHAGFSLGVARRYLKFLEENGSVELALRYGSAGRPEHLYRWTGPRRD